MIKLQRIFIIIKFWLHIDEGEQFRRYQDREATQHKQ